MRFFRLNEDSHLTDVGHVGEEEVALHAVGYGDGGGDAGMASPLVTLRFRHTSA